MSCTISIVIPVVNEADNIRGSIDKAWAAGADEVIVVDGGSTDQTCTLCESLDCVLVHSPKGRGTQLNQGAAVATSEFLLFLHADNWLVRGACEQIRDLDRSMRERSLGFGAFRQRIENSSWIYRWLEVGNDWRIRLRGLVYGDQALFIRRTIFESAGRFPDIPLMEDLAFSQSLKRFGKPRLLPGPTHVGARRWQEYGVVRQTLKNWFLSSAFLLGASPEWLARHYRRHDEMPQ